MDQPRDPPAPFYRVHAVSKYAGSGRHGPISDPLSRVRLGAPRSRKNYSFVAPPWIWGRGDRNATRRSSSTGF